MKAKDIRNKISTLKAESQALIDSNKLEEAEAKNVEIKVLNAQVELKEKLEDAETKIGEFENSISEKDKELSEVKASVETITSEKEELMSKYTEATNKVTELNDKVNAMQPIVEAHNKKAYEDKLNAAKESYKAKFESVDGAEKFETEEVQTLIENSISEDESISVKAKYELGEMVMNLLDEKSADTLTIANVQEPAVVNKGLNPADDEFEKTYGFKKA